MELILIIIFLLILTVFSRPKASKNLRLDEVPSIRYVMESESNHLRTFFDGDVRVARLGATESGGTKAFLVHLADQSFAVASPRRVDFGRLLATEEPGRGFVIHAPEQNSSEVIRIHFESPRPRIVSREFSR